MIELLNLFQYIQTMQYKKMFSLCCLVVYIFFSQFVIKAIATTDLATFSSDDFCVSKKLDTIDGKQDCREKNNSAIAVERFDHALELQIVDIQSDTAYIAYTDPLHHISDVAYYAHAPPWYDVYINTIYAHHYVGIILQLL